MIDAGALEQAMQAAESQGVLSSNDDLPDSSPKDHKSIKSYLTHSHSAVILYIFKSGHICWS